MARTLYGDGAVTDANSDDDNEGITRVSGNGCGKQAPRFHEKTRFSNNDNDLGDYHKRGVADDDGGAFVATLAAKRASTWESCICPPG